ncbi:hypothetical protein C8J56DRAFT_893477 [Mycena floridula]|nr:hypothetical protein C8J56DRAFT_893477 [Mycena floridula]
MLSRVISWFSCCSPIVAGMEITAGNNSPVMVRNNTIGRDFQSHNQTMHHHTHHYPPTTGGQGKTALALKVMAQLAMKQCYSGKNGVWISCEEATSAELLLNGIYTSLDITRDSHNTIQDILTELGRSSKPIILLLDNFETPWNAPGQRAAVVRILCDIAQFSHVALFITMRAATAPCEEITSGVEANGFPMA